MITGYVSSDEEDDDLYSDPLQKNNVKTFPAIQTDKIMELINLAQEDEQKVSLLLKAIENDDLESLQKLFSLGVSVDCCGPTEWTPLMKACYLGKFRSAEFLLSHGANPNREKELFSPLMACCSNSSIPEDDKLNCVQLLLQSNVLVNERDKYGMSALMYAAENGFNNIVCTLLLEPGININMQDKEGSTALLYAVHGNHVEIVKQLVDAKADLALTDKCERTALDIALYKQYYEAAEILGFLPEDEESDENCINSNPYYDILSEFPSPKGDIGFTADMESIIKTSLQYKLKKEISLLEYLNFTDNDLCNAGVLFEYDRKKLLKYSIHEYHLHPWSHSSMPLVTFENLKILNAVTILSSLTKHLSIANASVKYLIRRISSRLNPNLNSINTEQELITVLVNIYSFTINLRSLLKKIIKQSQLIEIVTPDDFISPNSQINKPKKNSVLFVVGVTVIAYLVYHFK